MMQDLDLNVKFMMVADNRIPLDADDHALMQQARLPSLVAWNGWQSKGENDWTRSYQGNDFEHY